MKQLYTPKTKKFRLPRKQKKKLLRHLAGHMSYYMHKYPDKWDNIITNTFGYTAMEIQVYLNKFSKIKPQGEYEWKLEGKPI